MATDKQTLHNRLKELEFLMKSSRALNSTLNIDQLVRVIVKIVRDAVQAETVSVLFFDARRENMVFEIAHGERDRELLGLKIPLGESIAGWVAKKQRPLIVNDLPNHPKYSLALERKIGLKSTSIMSIPLKRRNEVIGVIEAVNSRRPERFTGEDLKMFLTLADHIATAVDNARLYHEAERSRLENSQLYETGVALGMALTLDEVLQQIINNLRKIIAFDAVAIFVLDAKNQQLVSHLEEGYPRGKESKLRLQLDEGLVGWAARNKEGVRVPDVSKDKRYINANPKTRSEMVAPMLSRGKVIGLFNLESHRLDAFRSRDLRLLTTFAAQAAVSIERARLYESERAKREIDRELRIARTVQEFFTPSRSRRLGKYTLTGRNYPSLELSGDYHDAFPLRDPFVAFAIADVAGKGVPASIIMSSFRATLRTAAPYFTSAREIAARANDILLETVRPEDFVTAFIGVLDQKTGLASYCNAGHEPPILMKPDGRFELLETGGTVLGVFRNNKLQEGTFDMGDNLLFAYTDGTTDAINPKGESYGVNRLIRFLKNHRELPSVQICTELRKDLKAFMQGTPQADDLTFIALKK